MTFLFCSLLTSLFLPQACQSLALYDERSSKLRYLAKTRGTTISKLEEKLSSEKSRADNAEEFSKSYAKELKKAQTNLKKANSELKRLKDVTKKRVEAAEDKGFVEAEEGYKKQVPIIQKFYFRAGWIAGLHAESPPSESGVALVPPAVVLPSDLEKEMTAELQAAVGGDDTDAPLGESVEKERVSIGDSAVVDALMKDAPTGGAVENVLVGSAIAEDVVVEELPGAVAPVS